MVASKPEVPISQLLDKSSITSQRGLEKPMNGLQPNLAELITSLRSTNSPNWVQIGGEMAPPRGGEL